VEKWGMQQNRYRTRLKEEKLQTFFLSDVSSLVETRQ